ncbi:MAG: hypothetical protein OJF62_000989 [Pseudolabrys sp.]|nr:hypothetical protein [Pseudolabrys sp.]
MVRSATDVGFTRHRSILAQVGQARLAWCVSNRDAIVRSSSFETSLRSLSSGSALRGPVDSGSSESDSKRPIKINDVSRTRCSTSHSASSTRYGKVMHRRAGTPVFSDQETGIPGLQRIVSRCAAPGTQA